MSLRSVLFAVLLLAGCKPPASDDYVARIGLDPRQGPSEPLQSPDTTDAVWARSGGPQRIIYGLPGQRPLLALECLADPSPARIAYTRFAPADAEAKAVFALIGNGHVARLWIDATRDGERWLWKGAVPAEDPRLEALTGPRQVEATVPGAGSVILNPSGLPGQLITACRERGASEADPR